jgi:legumain
VTPENFLALLKGDKSAIQKKDGTEPRVLESTVEDHVFINFVDHGAPGLVAFPHAYLYADDL